MKQQRRGDKGRKKKEHSRAAQKRRSRKDRQLSISKDISLSKRMCAHFPSDYILGFGNILWELIYRRNTLARKRVDRSSRHFTVP